MVVELRSETELISMAIDAMGRVHRRKVKRIVIALLARWEIHEGGCGEQD